MVLQTKSAIIFLLLGYFVTTSCSGGEKNMSVFSIDIRTLPSVHTEDVSTLISDSGITRYRLEAKIWDIFSNAEVGSYWYFPEKIRVERFDSLFNVEGSILADTAYYFEKKELWQAIGNVVVKNMEGRMFETSELFWNLKTPANEVNAFYTDKFVTITEPNGDITYGRNGFKADQSLNIIRLLAVKGEFYVEESADTIQPPPQPDR
jgi:hypothetical protein